METAMLHLKIGQNLIRSPQKTASLEWIIHISDTYRWVPPISFLPQCILEVGSPRMNSFQSDWFFLETSKQISSSVQLGHHRNHHTHFWNAAQHSRHSLRKPCHVVFLMISHVFKIFSIFSSFSLKQNNQKHNKMQRDIEICMK